jgi:hypothetical protein
VISKLQILRDHQMTVDERKIIHTSLTGAEVVGCGCGDGLDRWFRWSLPPNVDVDPHNVMNPI